MATKHITITIGETVRGKVLSRVMEVILKLKKHCVDYSILTVVTDQLCGSVNEIYDFYKKMNLFISSIFRV